MVSSADRVVISTFGPHVLIHGLMASIPLFIPIWLAEFSVTRATLGLAVGILFVFYGGTAIPAGVFSDRLGSTRFIEVFLLGTGGAAILLSTVGSYRALIVGLVGLGIAAGLYHAPAFSLISRQDDATSKLFAYHNVGGHVGLGLGPLAMALLLAVVDWRTALFISAVPFGLIWLVFRFYGPDENPRTSVPVADGGSETTVGLGTQVKRLCTVGFAFVLVIYLLRGTYARGSVTFLPDYLDLAANLGPLWLFGVELPPGRWVYSAMLILGVGGQMLGGELGTRYREELILAVQLVSTAGLLVLLGRTDGRALFAVVGLFGIMMYSFPPILQSLVAAYSPERSRGLGYGITTAGNAAAGGFVGASLAGWLITNGSYPWMFTVLAVIPIAALVFILGYEYLFADRSDLGLC